MQPVPSQPEWRSDEAWAFTRGGLLLLPVLMIIAIVSQLLFAADSFYSNAGYVLLALTALVTALYMRSEARRPTIQKLVRRISVGLVAGSLLVGFIPGTQPYTFLLVMFAVLFWFWGSSTLIFPIANAIGWCLLGVYSLCVMITNLSPFESAGAAVISSSICGAFALVMAYGYRQILAFVLAQEREHELDGDETGTLAPGLQAEQSAGANVKWAAVLKATTLEMAATYDADAMYKKMLGRIKSAVGCDIVVLGKLQNRVMFPVLMWDKSGQRNVNGSLRMIWSLALLEELEDKKDVHAGLSDAALLDSFFDEGKVPFGYRLDIPFFSQKKLSGVVSLFRQKQEFNRYETDLTSSIVFHGMFAHRSALMQNRLASLNSMHTSGVRDMNSTQTFAVPKAAPVRIEAERDAGGGVLGAEEFRQKADSAFRHLEKNGKPVSLLLIEVDGCAKFVGKYSEQSLSRLFSQVSTLLQSNLPSGGLLGRYGKASFAVQVSMEPDKTKHLAEHLRYLVQKRAFMFDGSREAVTISIGVSSRTSKTLDFLSVLKRADISLNKAKYGVGNTVHVNV
jgi:diguanylate cyclase (GGDEF)-like protein